MKKIIPTFFLVVSASTNFLFGNITTNYNNQVTGNSEQALSREQRTGCRVQLIDSRKRELGLEDYIGQQANITTNYELPTTNCNNQGAGLDCYLMMDPAELKNIEEGIEGVKGSSGKVGISSKVVDTISAIDSPVRSSSSSVTALEKTTSGVVVASTVDETGEGNTTNAFLEEEICNNIYTSCLAKVAAMSQSRSLVVGGSSEANLQAAGEWKTAEDVAEIDLDQCKSVYDNAKREADESKGSTDYSIKKLEEALADARVGTARSVLKAIKAGNTTYRASAEVELASAQQNELNAVTAYNQAKEQAEITKWTVAAEEAQQKETTVLAAGKKEEGTQWYYLRIALSDAVRKKREAIQAEKSGKIELAKSLRDQALQNIQTSEFLTKSAMAYAAGKINEGSSWSNVSFACVRGAAQTKKAIQAEKEGKKELASLWCEAVLQNAQSSESYVKAATAFATGRTTEGDSWYRRSNALKSAAEQIGKAIEAEVNGRTELAAFLRKAVEQNIQVGEICAKAAIARATGKMPEGNSWHSAGKSLMTATEQTVRVFEAESNGKIELAALWREAALLNKQSCKDYTQAAIAHTEGRTSEGNNFDAMGKAAYDKAEAIAKQAEVLRLNSGTVKQAVEGIRAISPVPPASLALPTSPVPPQAKTTATEKESVETISPIQADETVQGEEKIDNSLCKYSVNPLIECAQDAIHYQGDSSNFNHRINQPPTSHLLPPTTIRPVGRIVSSLLSLSSFIPKTWYDEQIEVAERADIEALEKIARATAELEEAKKALKSIEEQVEQEENSEEAKSKLRAIQNRFQARLQELQTAGDLADQKVQQCKDVLKTCQDAVVQAKNAVQKVKGAKEYALKTIYSQIHQVGKDLVEGIELDQKKYDRGQRIAEATAKVDCERAEKTKYIQQVVTKIQTAHQIWNECLTDHSKIIEKCNLATIAIEQYFSIDPKVKDAQKKLETARGNCQSARYKVEEAQRQLSYAETSYTSAPARRVKAQKELDEAEKIIRFHQNEGSRLYENPQYTNCVNIKKSASSELYFCNNAGANRDKAQTDLHQADATYTSAQTDYNNIELAYKNAEAESAKAKNDADAAIRNVIAALNSERLGVVSAADAQAGVSLEQHWAHVLSAYDQVKNAWQSMIGTGSSWNKAQLEAAQQATKEADKAFQSLKEARENAYSQIH